MNTQYNNTAYSNTPHDTLAGAHQAIANECRQVPVAMKKVTANNKKTKLSTAEQKAKKTGLLIVWSGVAFGVASGIIFVNGGDAGIIGIFAGVIILIIGASKLPKPTPEQMADFDTNRSSVFDDRDNSSTSISRADRGEIAPVLMSQREQA